VLNRVVLALLLVVPDLVELRTDAGAGFLLGDSSRCCGICNEDDQAFAEAMQRHLSFFNTSPIIGGPFILGSTIAMEESSTASSADGIKVAMMGPLAGIGDALTFVVYNSIIFILASQWAQEGLIIGPIFAAVMVLVPYYWCAGGSSTSATSRARTWCSTWLPVRWQRFNEGLVVLGLIVLGGFIPSIVKIVTTLHYASRPVAGGKAVAPVTVQSQLDQVLPFLLPVLLTALILLPAEAVPASTRSGPS